MGDGGVACVPSQLVMERFPNSETFCGGNGGNFNSKSLVQSQLQRKPEKKMEVEKEELENGKMGSVKVQKAKVEKAEFVSDKRRKEDIEKGEIVPEKLRKGEVEMGEIVLEKWRKSAVDKEEFGFARGRKGELEKGEFVPEKWRRGEVEKSEFSSGRGRKGELEKGEFVPEKWRKGEAVKEEFGSKKGRKWETERGEFVADNGRKGERERSPKRLSRWENTREKDSRSGSSRVADEDLGSYKHEYSDRKNHSREYTPGSWLKRNGIESESSGHKYHGDFGDYSASKVRRISDDNGRSSYSEKLLSRRSVEKSYRNSSSSSSRYSSRGAHDRHGRSPVSHSERSPLERARHYDHRDRSPAYLERSPHDRTRHYDHRDRSPVYSERSPHDRPRHYDHRDRSPAYSERSPHERPRHYDHRDRSPAYAERSPLDRVRHHDHRDRTPGYSERSPQDRGRTREYRETNRKNGGSEKQHSRYGNKGHEERIGRKDSSGRDSHAHSSTKPSHTNSANGPEKIVDDQPHKEKQSQNPSADCNEPPSQVSGAPEEFPSMEEDMDICDTPPHVPVMTDPNMGKWFYLDHFGVEQGPSKLRDLKKLVEDGFLLSDHLIKHRESDRWVTVENAASPLVPVNLPSVVSDSVTQLVDPPEAPGNLLVDVGDVGQSVNQPTQELSISSSQPTLHPNDRLVAPELLEDLHIDERVGALLKGYTVIPGRELESVGEALHTSFEHAEWEKWGSSEGFTRFRACTGELSRHSREEEPYRGLEGMQKETVETRLLVPSEKEYVFVNGDSSDWFAGRWSCKGGDWKRNDEATQDKSLKRKVVLNEGYPLCQMPKSGYQDPRWQRKDDLYHPSRIKRLDLPPWSFSWPEEKNDVSSDSSKSLLLSRSNQVKPLVARGIKGTTLPVVRINACVVKDSGPLICESRVKVKGNERHSSRSVRSFSVTSDSKHSFTEGISRSKKVHERDLQGLLKCRTSVNIPKDRVCTVAELELPLGDWYYLDCAGHEHGPSSFSELHTLVAKGTIQNHSSVFRKIDNIWVPITTFAMPSEVHAQEEKEAPTADSATTILGQSQISQSVMNTASSSFHNLHPQFIGYTRGKLHELVMKSYKSREFAAAINEVLDPWISAKQPKKELDKHFPFSSSITKSSTIYKSRKSEEDHIRAGKRARLLVDESEDDSEMEDDLLTRQMNDCLFEDLLDDASFGQENCMTPQTETESWGFLNGRILARVFHFLRADMKSLAFSAATCKRWNMAVKFYKGVSRQVDLSSTGPECTDPMFLKVMSCYDKTKVTSVVLMGCTNVSAGALEEVLQSFPCISSIDIRGCNQFSELMHVSKNVKWLRSSCARNTKIVEESHSKIRSLKQITEKSYLTSKAFKGSGSHLEDSGEPRDSFDHDSNLDKKDSASHSFRQSCYKRTKLLDARKSSSVLSRDARMRRWLRRKPETGYKRMEEFLAFSLKDIMKENTFEFFIPKVAEIEDRMRNGYYVGHGLSSVKEDISRMCRDAIKAKNRGDARDMNHIIMLFIRLVTNLEENSKSSNGRDDMVKTLKDSSVAGFSAASKYKKKHNKYISDRRGMNKSNSSSHVNGIVDYGDYASDREIRRRLSKLNKRSLDSESETSDDPGFSEEDVRGDGESTSSDTESDLDIHSEGGTGDLRGDGYFPVDEGLDSMSEEREWGARMTKASLVPPVTRKYEVIDRYVVIADEEEVQRKMRVALPEDYAEKLSAQKSGTEESDMEIPEVKEYKPRKQLGDEVLEQEVYGIDPYTHNLLLDSMPEESDWPLLEKHLFIEEVLLRALNKKVRHFTGTGNTPMVYPLKPVVEEIQKTAEEGGDTRMVKMCQCIIKAMQNRTDDNYVAYRKGLGVVCNKEEGFGEDDFVVEFLGEVYPTWKWFEKQDGIRSLQKNNNDPAPEFYNIYLERPKGDRDGYDLVVVDAMHKANYASRICHSCRPNAEAKVTAVNGQYQIGIYTVRPIGYGEEITFDYNSVTESKEEYEASVCLCGSQVCRGSYLNLTGEGAYQKVLKERHGILDRHQLLLEACEVNSVSQEDYIDLGRAGLGTCLLAGLPEWLISYSARLVRFINFERTKLPEEILKHNMEEKRKFFSDICLEVEKSDAEIQAEGVYNQRLQNLALTLDKVRYVMRCVYGDPKKAPPPLVKLSPEVLVSAIWKGEGSLVEELLQCIAPHMEADLLNDLKSKIHAHDPSGSDDLQGELRKSLLWLRDEIRHLPCTYKCRHDATADLIHIYAYTKFFFKVQEYKAITSPPVYISPLDLGPKYSDKLGSGFQEYCKTYGENYCLGQLIYWHNQANAEPDCSLARARRGCLSLPDFSSFYAKSQKPSRKRVYGPRTFKFMLARMEKQSQRQWPKDRIWSFKSSPRIFGSPMLDAVVNKSPLDREMMHWLKNRPAVFQAMWDR